MFYSKKLFLAFIFLLSIFTQFGYSQNPYNKGQGSQGQLLRGDGDGSMRSSGSISGSIIDNKTAQGVEYANIVIYRSNDSVMAGGCVTNPKGSFLIDKLAFGNYYMVISFIGYSSLRIPNITLSPKDPQKKMGEIKFSPSSNNLDGVVITGERRMMEYSLDKKVVNVEKDLVSAGGSAVDLIQNIP